MTDFNGFGPKTSKFLRELGRNNEKAWFDAHRADYEAHYLEPAKAFVEAAGPRVERFAPHISWEPRVNGSLFRVNRDIRFSKDKTPYKDHIDLWFWEGDRKTALSGFYLRVRAMSVEFGVGAHRFSKEALLRYRESLTDDAAAKSLVSMIKRFERNGYRIFGKTYKQVPRGFVGGVAAQELVLFSGLAAGAERKSPPEIRSAKFLAYCSKEWKKLAPLHQWLMEHVG